MVASLLKIQIQGMKDCEGLLPTSFGGADEGRHIQKRHHGGDTSSAGSLWMF